VPQSDETKDRKAAPLPLDEPPEEGAGDGAKVAAILFVIVLVVGCIWLFNRLSSANQELNCVASGRRDCASTSP
jgi:hypothetical protein